LWDSSKDHSEPLFKTNLRQACQGYFKSLFRVPPLGGLRGKLKLELQTSSERRILRLGRASILNSVLLIVA
jgi:hypothetical protein